MIHEENLEGGSWNLNHTIMYSNCPGSTHAGPDCLSRLEQGSPDPVVIDEGYFDRKVYCIDQGLWDLLQDQQHHDLAIRLAKDQLLEYGKITKGRYKYYSQLYVEDDLVTKSGRVLVPAVSNYQSGPQQESLGIYSTYNNIAKNFLLAWSEKIYQTFCSECDVCLKCKYPNRKPRAALNPIPWGTYKPRDYMTMDIATTSKTYDELHSS